MNDSTAGRAEFAPWDIGCLPMHLTLRLGPSAGRTLVYCTCGWEHTYRTRHKALKRIAEHVTLSQPSRPTGEAP